MTIQPARPDDLDSVRRLLETAGLPHKDLTLAHLRHFLVAHEDGPLRGVVGLEPCGGVALLRSLAVHPEARDAGIGARLVTAIEQRAWDEGIRTLYLLTTTAASYFQAHGYEHIERDALPESIAQTEEAGRICPASATAMRKRIPTTEQA